MIKIPQNKWREHYQMHVFIVFSSATFLHWCMFFSWSAHIGERPNHKVISVWTQQGLPGQSPPCGVTQGCGIFEARSLFSSQQVVIDPHMILAALLWTHQVLENLDSRISKISWKLWVRNCVLMLWLSIVYFKIFKIKFRKIWFTPVINQGGRIFI